MIIDCTEFNFQHVSNLDLNSRMFSNYKNTITGKALTGIAPHGMGLFFSVIYPGSLSDNYITEKSGVFQWIQPEHELMADRGFANQGLCALKGIYRKGPCISRTFFHKIEAKNRGCGLSRDTSKFRVLKNLLNIHKTS